MLNGCERFWCICIYLTKHNKYTNAKIFSEVGKKTEMFARFSTVAGERVWR